MSDDASDILPDAVFKPPEPPSTADDVIPAHAMTPRTPDSPDSFSTQMGHMALDTAGTVARGVGDVAGLYKNIWHGIRGEPTKPVIDAMTETGDEFAKPFEHDPDVEPPPDQKELARRALPKLGDQPMVKAAVESPAGKYIAHELRPVGEIANAVGTVQGVGNLVRSGVNGLMSPKAAEVEASPSVAFDSPPVEGGLPAEVSAERQAVLKRVGIDTARNSALTGDAKAAATNFQLSKFDEPAGIAAKAQFDSEKAALNSHAAKIVNETGGTLGMDEDTLNSRGQSIAAPFDKLRQYFDDQKKAAYDVAGARAQGVPIKDLSTTSNLLKDPDFTETLLAKDQGGLLQSIQRQFQRFQDLNPGGMTVENAENFRKWMNQVWTPENSATLGKVKGALDNDVLKGAGEDIYGPARKIVQMEAKTLDNPNGISKLMDFDPKNPLNRTTAYSKIPDTLARLDPEQFHNVIKTLDTMPEELQPEAQAAKAEIKAHFANKVLDAGSSTQGQWNAPAVSKVIKANSAKLQSAFADQPETLSKIRDLDSAGKILKVDQSYPGAAAQAANILRQGGMSQVLSKGGALAGGAAGGTIGAIVAGPPGAAVGSTAGAAIGGGLANKLGANAAEKAALKRWNAGTTKLYDVVRQPPP